jgi:uncharacterized repeat protein (TIGR01451 family)
MNYYILFLVFLFSTNYHSQINLEWQDSFGGSGTDWANSICQTSDGGYVFAARSNSLNGDVGLNLGYEDFWIVKLSNSGLIEWTQSLGGSLTDIPNSIKQTLDGGYIVAGMTQSSDGNVTANNGDFDCWVVKLNSLGIIQWQKSLGGTNVDLGQVVIQTSDEGYLIGGRTNSINGDVTIGFGLTDCWIIKLDSNGNLVWQKSFGGSGGEQIYDLQEISSGGYVVAAYSTSSDGDLSSNYGGWDYWVFMIDDTGNLIWERNYGGSGNEQAKSISETIDGYVVVGHTESNDGDINSSNGSADIWALKIDYLGNIVWERSFGGGLNDYGYTCISNPDGSIVIAGITNSSLPPNYFGQSCILIGVDVSGILLWQRGFGGSLDETPYSIQNTNDGGYIVACDSRSTDGDITSNNGDYDAWIVKFRVPKISGSVFLDLNENCNRDNLEIGIVNYNLLVSPTNQIIGSDFNGNYWIDSLPAGEYTITVDTTNLNWLPTCPITQSFTVTNPNVFTAGPDFGLISTNPCSDPSVSIYAPFLRPCLPNQMIYVQACNQTTATGILNASYVDVELDPLMTVTASSIPYTLQSANVYRFQTGNLNPGQCANFSISTTIGSPAVGCATLLGQTLCMDANLYPVQSCALDNTPSNPPSGGGGSTGGGTLDGLPEPCTLPWDQSSLSVDGWCQNDTIYFTITNTGELGGGDMECYSPLWVTVDGVVTYTDSIMIQGGQTITYSFPGDGATWILNAAQHPLHPGNSNPNAHVEACGDLSNWTSDLVNDFPQDDADPVVDIYCGIVTGSYDPNDKTGYPNGVTEQRYIQPDQHLQYVIRFQNTGTDTAFTVVIRDTLDIDLNIFTVTPGVSSHNYEFRMYGPRVLEWTFNNILLPDSTTNEPESNGFVTFQVQQVPNLAPGTEIKNAADIYFDFNDPIRTNTTIHRIYEGFVNVATLEELSKEKSRILVYPNPSNGIITVVLKDKDNSNYDIFDQMGRIVKSGSLDEKKTSIQLDLQNGMYYLKVGDAVVKVQIR